MSERINLDMFDPTKLNDMQRIFYNIVTKHADQLMDETQDPEQLLMILQDKFFAHKSSFCIALTMFFSFCISGAGVGKVSQFISQIFSIQFDHI